MTLWHADIRLPDGAVLPRTVVNLEWSRHADGERTKDRYHSEIPAFPALPLHLCRIIEVETEGRAITKWVVRIPWRGDLDLVFVLIPRKGSWFVKTVWINERNDSHKTLDRSRYAS